jgi:hypothetical protein
MGGKIAETAYRRFVESGLETPPTKPIREALKVDGWVTKHFSKR